MKAPRYAHWLVVPTLAFGMALTPVRADAAPASKVSKLPPAAKTEPTKTEPTGEVVEAPAGKAGEAPKGKPGEAPKASPKPDAEPTDPAAAPGTPKTPEAGEGTEPTDAAPTDAAPTDAAPTDAEPTEVAPTEAPLEPEVTVSLQPVDPSVDTKPLPSTAPSRDVVADPRRIRSDDRILFRAGILSLGVAVAAVVPTVVGFQQASVAHQDDDAARERTMRGLGIGAGIAAGTYAITGAVLLSLGARKRRAMVAPAIGPGQLGAVLRARF